MVNNASHFNTRDHLTNNSLKIFIISRHKCLFTIAQKTVDNNGQTNYDPEKYFLINQFEMIFIPKKELPRMYRKNNIYE